MASKQRLLIKLDWSRIFFLDFLESAISGLVKTWVYPPFIIFLYTDVRLFFPFKTINFALVIRFIIVLCSAWSSFSGIRMRIRPGTRVIKGRSWKIKLLPKPVLASNKRSLCSKKSMWIASTYLSRNENPKIIWPTSLHRCHSRAINAFPYSGSSAVSTYSYQACNAAVLASLSAKMEASSSSKIGRMASAWGRIGRLGVGVCIVLRSRLELCINLFAVGRA